MTASRLFVGHEAIRYDDSLSNHLSRKMLSFEVCLRFILFFRSCYLLRNIPTVDQKGSIAKDACVLSSRLCPSAVHRRFFKILRVDLKNDVSSSICVEGCRETLAPEKAKREHDDSKAVENLLSAFESKAFCACCDDNIGWFFYGRSTGWLGNARCYLRWNNACSLLCEHVQPVVRS